MLNTENISTKKVSEIRVRSLFGLFDYDIPLHDNGVTLLIGVNGSGKTTLFKMLHNVLNKKFHELLCIQFKSFEIYFNDGDFIKCKKRVVPQKDENLGLVVWEEDSKYFEAIDKLWDQNKILQYFDIVVKLNDFEKKHNLIKLNSDVSDAIDYTYSEVTKDMKNAFKACNFSPRLIETQRLHLDASDDDSLNDDLFEELIRAGSSIKRKFTYRDSKSHGRINTKKRIEEYAKDLSKNIQLQRSNYFAESQDIEKRTLIEYLEKEAFNYGERGINLEAYDDLKKASSDIRNHMNKLLQLGIYKSHEIDQIGDLSLVDNKLAEWEQIELSLSDVLKDVDEEEINEEEINEEEINEEEINEEVNESIEKMMDIALKFSLLKSYTDNMRKKLAVFEDLENKIELFRSNIKNLFINKTMDIDLENGFIFKLTEGQEKGQIIDPKGLSSGEQHEVVLNYELIFKTNESSVIMIDEPEISLHIYWQKKFIDNILKISKENNLNIIVATHSPDIVHNHRDLVCRLNDMKIKNR